MSDADPQRPSAEIIPFPIRTMTAPPAHEPAPSLAPEGELPENPTERLRRALAILASAQAEQRDAVRRFQDVVGDLRRSLTDLGQTLHSAQPRSPGKPAR